MSAGDTVYIQLRERVGGGNTADYSFSLSFSPTGNPPHANDDTAATDRLTPVVINVLDNDDDGTGNPPAPGSVSIIVTSPPSNGTFAVDNAAGTVTYTPNSPFDPLKLGDDTFKYKINNGSDSNEATVIVTVNSGSNQDPVANDKTYSTPAGSAISGNAITAVNAQSGSADDDPDGDALTVSGWGPVVYGTLTPDASNDGTFTYTPNSGFTGTDSFDYVLDDGYGGSATATVTINVTTAKVDLSVHKSASSGSVLAGQPLTFTLHVESSDTNTSYTDADNVVVTDTLPAGIGYNGVNPSAGFACSESLGTVTCTAASLSPGYSGDIVIAATALVESNVTNTVDITSDTPEFNNLDNESSVDVQIVASSADLSLSKTAPASVNTASQFAYTLTVNNAGPNAAENVQVTDDLPANVQFVSVDGGSEWSCSQGPLVICDYVANSGIMPTGTAHSITINVTSPPQSDTVLNSADVVTTIPDPDITNNHDEASVSVNFGTNIGGSVPLTKYLQFNVFGDIKLIGNANINKNPGDADQNYNDDVNMVFVGYQNKNSIFNASSSTLSIDPSYEIAWAGLYWAGHICKNGDGCSYSHLPNNRNSYGEAKPHLGEVKFKRPSDSSYIDLVANNLNRIERNSNGATDLTYGAFADITHMIDQSNFNGTYSVANMLLTEGKTDGRGGNYGGWALLFIFKDPANQLHFKNVSVFNGFQYITSDNNNIDIDGFVTPLSGDINSSIALFAADGDPQLGGTAKMREGKANSYDYIGGDALNPTSNLLNSTISEFGSPINTGITRTYGVDADRINVSSFIDNNQTDTRFKFNVTNSQDSHVDWYSLNMFAFATDLVSPLIDGFSKSAVIHDLNGSTRAADENASIYPGSELTYTLTFTNSGDEIAEEVEMFDDFDFDGLSSLLDLSNFNISKIRLSKKNSNQWQTNPNCGYYGGEHRVYCKLGRVDIGDTYKMEFSVYVRSSLTAGDVDKNVTNTAYSRYKNPTTGSYVVLYDVNGQSVGGKSNALTAGRIAVSGGGSGSTYPTQGVDAINTLYGYASDRNITTKIVAKPFSLKLVHLDASGNPSAYVTNKSPMPVLLSLCTRDDIIITSGAVPEFDNNNVEIVATNLIVPQAFRDDRIKMHFIDWNSILDWPNAPNQCVHQSSLTGNLNLVPQCLNSANNMRQLFPKPKWAYIQNVCLGDSLSLSGNQVSACNSSAYNGGGVNPSKSIVPSKYNHAYGCYQCLADANASFVSCSSDNFAARPEKFTMSSSSPHYPDLLRSGMDYNMTVHAPNGNGVDTNEYNQTHDNLDLNQTLYYSDNTVAPIGGLNGSLQFSTSNDFNISDGLSVNNSGSNEVMGISFDDVGKVGVTLIDDNWAAVDSDDTPQDCSNTLNANGEYGAFVCGEDNATFIPEHFKVVVDEVHNHEAGDLFTYLSSDLDMAAKVGVTLTSENALGGTTLNFSKESVKYENPVKVNLTVNPNPYNGDAALTREISAARLGFTNGVKVIPWDESNTSLQLAFNYPRQVNLPVNPFEINGSMLSADAASLYTSTQGAPDGTATIVGSSGVFNDEVLFIYGRAHSPRFRVPCSVAGNAACSTDANKPVKIYYEFYYDIGLSIDANSTMPALQTLTSDNDRGTDAINWYINTAHTASEGNITHTEPTVNPSKISEGSYTDINGMTLIPYTYDGSENYPYKATMRIQTNSWLIYNRFDASATENSYEIEFNNDAGSTTGSNRSGAETDSDANINTSRRIQW